MAVHVSILPNFINTLLRPHTHKKIFPSVVSLSFLFYNYIHTIPFLRSFPILLPPTAPSTSSPFPTFLLWTPCPAPVSSYSPSMFQSIPSPLHALFQHFPLLWSLTVYPPPFLASLPCAFPTSSSSLTPNILSVYAFLPVVCLGLLSSCPMTSRILSYMSSYPICSPMYFPTHLLCLPSPSPVTFLALSSTYAHLLPCHLEI